MTHVQTHFSRVAVFLSLVVTWSTATSAWRSPNLVSTGLQNLGNTCYLNAQLQCAFHIPVVRSLILSSEGKKAVNLEESCIEQSISVGYQALRILFLTMAQASENHSGPVSTQVLCNALGIPVFEQQDSQEFWKLLLPALGKTELSDLYQGAFEDYIVALDGSGRAKRREEPFLDLSLDISRGSVEESLKTLFGDPELLSNAEGNGWRPEKGADKVDAQKGSLLRAQGLPSILQLHLKRFDHDWNTGLTSKLNTPFVFSETLDLSNICAEVEKTEQTQCIYDLQAVVIHNGEYGSGHYYSYVRPRIENEEWCRFNDEAVTRGLTFPEVTADAFGGRTGSAPNAKGMRGLFAKLFGGLGSYGYGGRSSSAYVLQYVKRGDISTLYLG